MSDSINRMDIAEFCRLGYLQELNRRVLHPCGLALEVIVNEDGTEQFGGVWDYRDDPEGMLFDAIDQSKVEVIDAEIERHAAARIAVMGSVVQERAL